MFTCDLCSKEVTETIKTPSAIFLDAVRNGFNPYEIPGIEMPPSAPGQAEGDKAIDAAYLRWKETVLAKTNDWMLCQSCNSEILKFESEFGDQLLAVTSELEVTQPHTLEATRPHILETTQPNAILGDTQPTAVKSDTQPNPPVSSPGKKFPIWPVVLVMVILVAIGVLGGYNSGMSQRFSAQDTQVSNQLEDQYQLGVQAAKAGQYDMAKQHFEFVIQHNPDFPGVQLAYANLLVQMLITPTPVPSLTPVVTSTPDTRGVDEVYNSIVALLSAPGANLCGRDWDGIIDKLNTLRKDDSIYKATQVDGMYYIALRSRGVCKIYPQTFEPNANCQDLHINLEGGIYDLTLAEGFGPLDTAADGLRTWARLYIAGASFWDQDWVQVKNYFSQVMAAVPNLADSNCTTATEQWRLASIGYAEQLAANGDFCGADQQYKDAFSINSSKNATAYPTATAVRNQCAGNSGTPKPKKTKTPSSDTTPVITPANTPANTPATTT